MNYENAIRHLLLLCASLFITAFVTSNALAAQFLGGPSVRVNPNTSIEFKWITDVAWFGKVELFTTPDGSGTPLLTKRSEDLAATAIKATQQTITVDIGPALSADTTYYVKVTASDPTGATADLISPAPLAPFFTGVQTISNVRADSITTAGATISWQSNVIGLGKVTFGTPTQSVQDAFNITDHAIDLTGLAPGTTYQFTVSNKHAIDGDDLVIAAGQFSTAQAVTNVVFTEPQADPRVIRSGQVSNISIKARSRGNPVAGVVITFSIDPSSEGRGAFSSTQAVTDFNGIACVQFIGTTAGVVRINVTSQYATNSPFNIPVVVR
jgi:hypothetical protein